MAYYDSGVCYDSGVRYDEEEPEPPSFQSMFKYIKLGLGSKSYEQKVAQGNAINAGVSGHAAIYPTPNPTLATFAAAISDLSAKLTARENALEAMKAATEALHASEATYDGLVTQLGMYAENVTAGDANKLELGGFELRKVPVPIGELGIVENLQLRCNGSPSRLYAKWSPLYGAKSYEVETCEDPVSDEKYDFLMSSTGSKATLDGLSSGKRIWVRVRGVANKSLGLWSQPACMTAP
jgi:hypothetical protein